MTTLRIARELYPVTVLGFGRRLGIWTQGCPLACRGCMSRDTWDPDGGHAAPIGDLVRRWKQALAAGADGLTISGGEPLTQPDALAELMVGVNRVRQANPDHPADVLLYTGYEEGEFSRRQLQALNGVDAVMTGRFLAERPTDKAWRGSSNQRLWLRTPLAVERYAAYTDGPADTQGMQVHIANGQILLIGVPRRGDLGRLERGARLSGIPIQNVTWRPQ